MYALSTDSFTECEACDVTTSVEISDDNLNYNHSKRSQKRKEFPDFLTGMSVVLPHIVTCTGILYHVSHKIMAYYVVYTLTT